MNLRGTKSAAKEQGGAMEAVFLTVQEVAEKLTISCRQVWRLVSRGEFPKPIKLGRLNRWSPEDVTKFVEQLKSRR